jgi:hypothetical protein
VSEALSDERFIELFGNEAYQDFNPEASDYCSESAKKACYLGKKPFEFTYGDSCRISDYWDDMDIVSYYGILPATLLGLLKVPNGMHDNDWYLRSFRPMLNENRYSTDFIKDCFSQLGYECKHIEYMIQMFAQLRFMVTDDDPTIERPTAIIDYSIERLRSLL